MKVLIVSGGKAPSKELLINEIKDCSLIIGADKGCEALINNNIKPDYILGDFDSIDNSIYQKLIDLNINRVQFNPEKDFTDSELALYKAMELGATKITLLGCTGTRIDHVFSNIGLLEKAIHHGVLCEIKDDNNRIFLTDKPMTLKGEVGQTISFHSYKEVVKNFNIKGAKYPLINYDLNPFDGRTVSNEFLDSDITITFNKGKILVFYTND